MTARQPMSEHSAPYLWDRSGPADAEIEQLERALAPLRYRASSALLSPVAKPRPTTSLMITHRAPLRAAAVLALFIAGVWGVSLFSTSVKDVGITRASRNMHAAGALEVTALDGSPRIAGRAIAGSSPLQVGQWIETDAKAQAEIAVAQYGTVKIEPGSRLQLVHAKEKEQRLQLARGSLSARITAPPRLFIVDTPAASAVDLGCAYRLAVDDAGNGEIAVTLGWVSMEMGADHAPSVVPWGAQCLTRKGQGVGTPFYGDASVTLRRALEQFDFESGGTVALQTVLSEARDDDSLTLWHLLARSEGNERGMVFDRLAGIVPPPDGVSREQIMAGDNEALLAWRDTFMWSPDPATSPIK